MKRIKLTKVLTGLIITMALTGFLVTCDQGKEKASNENTNAMIIVFSTGGSILRSGETIRAAVGTVVASGDTLKTESGILDLQSRSGTAIRIREFTTISVAQLITDSTRIDLKHGTILAKVKRGSKRETFTVTTPTAIAGVRGTTFKVEVLDDTQPPTVKVMSGKVAMSPRFSALEKVSKEELSKNPMLKRLAMIQKKEEVILEKETVGTLDPKLDKKVKEINKASAAGLDKKSKIIKKLTREIEKKSSAGVVTKKEKMSVQDFHDTSAMVSIDKDTFDKVANKEEADKNTEIAALKKLYQKKRDENQERILKKIEEEATKKKLVTEADIKKQYNRFEEVVLKDGKKIRGAVIATTNNVLVVHTKSGVKRIRKSNVNYQQMLSR